MTRVARAVPLLSAALAFQEAGLLRYFHRLAQQACRVVLPRNVSHPRYDLAARLEERKRSGDYSSRSAADRAGPRDEAIMTAEAAQAHLAYLDYNATAPVRPQALKAVSGALNSVGNASSIHAAGRDAAGRVDTARGQLAGPLNARPGRSSSPPGRQKRITWPSGLPAPPVKR